MDYEGVYEYCVGLQRRAVTDAYFHLNAGDTKKFKQLLGLARETLAMIRCCLAATERVH